MDTYGCDAPLDVHSLQNADIWRGFGADHVLLKPRVPVQWPREAACKVTHCLEVLGHCGCTRVNKRWFSGSSAVATAGLRGCRTSVLPGGYYMTQVHTHVAHVVIAFSHSVLALVWTWSLRFVPFILFSAPGAAGLL
jgi:hypothetical protein